MRVVGIGGGGHGICGGGGSGYLNWKEFSVKSGESVNILIGL